MYVNPVLTVCTYSDMYIGMYVCFVCNMYLRKCFFILFCNIYLRVSLFRNTYMRTYMYVHLVLATYSSLRHNNPHFGTLINSGVHLMVSLCAFDIIKNSLDKGM